MIDDLGALSETERALVRLHRAAPDDGEALQDRVARVVELLLSEPDREWRRADVRKVAQAALPFTVRDDTVGRALLRLEKAGAVEHIHTRTLDPRGPHAFGDGFAHRAHDRWRRAAGLVFVGARRVAACGCTPTAPEHVGRSARYGSLHRFGDALHRWVVFVDGPQTDRPVARLLIGCWATALDDWE